METRSHVSAMEREIKSWNDDKEVETMMEAGAMRLNEKKDRISNLVKRRPRKKRKESSSIHNHESLDLTINTVASRRNTSAKEISTIESREKPRKRARLEKAESDDDF